MKDNERKPSQGSWLLVVGFVILFILAVPWYWGEGREEPLIFGMPLWVGISTFISFLISCLTAWVAFRVWPSDGDQSEVDE